MRSKYLINTFYFPYLIFVTSLLLVDKAESGELKMKDYERSDWGKFFEEFKASGTIVVSDERKESESNQGYNLNRANVRVSPASTFKIPHTLIALKARVVRDEYQKFTWDKVKRPFESHNQDQDLRSAMRNSAVWVYEIFASAISKADRERDLKLMDYGNSDTSGKGNYWIDGNLKISPFEQIKFLKKFYRNELQFKIEHQRLVKDLIIIQADKSWILRGKTGWDGSKGWLVGWVEHPAGAVFFALNIDTPNRVDDLFKREAIVREVLKSIDALPK